MKNTIHLSNLDMVEENATQNNCKICKAICKLCTFTYSTENVKRQINLLLQLYQVYEGLQQRYHKNINPCENKDNCKDLRSCKRCRFKNYNFAKNINTYLKNQSRFSI